MITILEKLNKIQVELKAPKSQYNKYADFNYRNCEDILEAIKPLLEKYGAIITLHDEVVTIGDRYYLRATATLTNIEDGKSYSTTAYAREENTKPKMDGSQITGSSSSYARKYALNGLLAIDDAKDADTTNTFGKGEAKEVTKETTKETTKVSYKDLLAKWCEANNLDKLEVAIKYHISGKSSEEDYKAACEGLGVKYAEC